MSAMKMPVAHMMSIDIGDKKKLFGYSTVYWPQKKPSHPHLLQLKMLGEQTKR
jgi:hypothetical protein